MKDKVRFSVKISGSVKIRVSVRVKDKAKVKVKVSGSRSRTRSESEYELDPSPIQKRDSRPVSYADSCRKAWRLRLAIAERLVLSRFRALVQAAYW